MNKLEDQLQRIKNRIAELQAKAASIEMQLKGKVETVEQPPVRRRGRKPLNAE
jgi:TolA-binding protein